MIGAADHVRYYYVLSISCKKSLFGNPGFFILDPKIFIVDIWVPKNFYCGSWAPKEKKKKKLGRSRTPQGRHAQTMSAEAK